jgi:hypothetical protein
MPKSYEKERDRLIAQGVPEQEAKKRAAIHYNQTHKRKMGRHKKEGK